MVLGGIVLIDDLPEFSAGKSFGVCQREYGTGSGTFVDFKPCMVFIAAIVVGISGRQDVRESVGIKIT